MPQMNGIKILKKIRANPETKDLPVLMLTASQDQANIFKAVEQRVTDYVIKPPQREDLLKRLERILGGRPQYEEIEILADESISNGEFLMPFKLRSVSQNGLIFISNSMMLKGEKLKISHLELFKKIGLEKGEFVIVDCAARDDGKFDNFVSFMGLKSDEQKRLKEWIMSETYRRRNLG
jgi:DNA-binding response OmpR family regulator